MKIRHARSLLARLAVGAAAAAALLPAAAVADLYNEPKLVFELGRGYYLRYCASCHGPDHRGTGPAAPALKKKPADLTQLARRYGNPIPRDVLASFIDGREDVASHGTRTMPVWGEELFSEEPASERLEQRKRGTILLLLSYLEQIQDYEDVKPVDSD